MVRGFSCVKTCAAARPSFSAVSAVTGSTLAVPRTPSVPKILFGAMSGFWRNDDFDVLGQNPQKGDPGRCRDFNAFEQIVSGFDSAQINQRPDFLTLETLQSLSIGFHGHLHFFCVHPEDLWIFGGGQNDNRQDVGAALGIARIQIRNRGKLLTYGEGNRQPNENGECKRKELEPEIMKEEMSKKGNHLATLVEVVVAGASSLVTTTGPVVTRFLFHDRSQPKRFRDRTGVTRTEVRNERNASMLTPRTKLPLYACEMAPFSSETATTTASVSSVRPMAARCRVPSDLLKSCLCVS